MSKPLYQTRGNPQNHEEELKQPPLSAKDAQTGSLPGAKVWEVDERLSLFLPLGGKGKGECCILSGYNIFSFQFYRAEHIIRTTFTRCTFSQSEYSCLRVSRYPLAFFSTFATLEAGNKPGTRQVLNGAYFSTPFVQSISYPFLN